jgi:uncharacterized membrane protein YkvA (DUF1232 family)
MLRRFRFFKNLFHDLPRLGKLSYCLVRDDRVPMRNRALFGTAMAAIVTPFINLPEVIPFVGELDVLALSLIAMRVFIGSCPDELVAEHEQLIIEQRSRFDQDFQKGERFAVALAGRLRRRDGRAGHELVGLAREEEARRQQDENLGVQK